MESPAATADDLRQVLEQFLAGRVHLDLLLATVHRVLHDDPDAAHAIQAHADGALREGALPESVWEKITAEVDQALSEDAPTQSREDEPTAPRSAVPPVLEDRVTAAPEGDAPAAGPMQPGTLLCDRYVIVSRAHTGGMGDVYKALDRQKKEAGHADPWVAIKMIGEEFAHHPQALAALQREAENCKKLAHPNIVRVFDFEQDESCCFLTMEWLEGESLVQVLDRSRQKAPTQIQLRRIILGLGAALAHAHAMGVTHADVKPGNVFVTRDGAVKLLDFGIARTSADTAPREGDLDANTPAYSSCEILQGESPVPADDVFSYALVVYRLLAGKRAFGHSTALEAEAAALVPERPSKLSDQAWQALTRALAFRRARRHADVASFLEHFTAPPDAAAETAGPELDAPLAATGSASETQAPLGPEDLAVEGGFSGGALDDQPLPLETARGEDDIEVVHAAPAARTGRWRRPAALAAAAVALAVAAAWWFGGMASDPGHVVQSTSATRPSPGPPPGRSAAPPEPSAAAAMLEPVAVSAERMEATDPPAADDGQAAAAGAGEAAPESRSPTRSRRATDTARRSPPREARSAPAGDEEPPAPDAQLASVVAAPAVSPAGRTPPEAGRNTQPPSGAAPAAVGERPADASPASRQEPPAASPDTAAPGAVADTQTAPAPAAASAAVRSPEPAAAAPGELAAVTGPVGPPVPDRAAPAPPDQYGPAPGPDAAGPEPVPMSELEFSRFVEPRYPRSRSARNSRGWVEVQFRVDAEGNTADVRVVAAEPPGLFDDAATAAVERWRFKPKVVDGEAVAVNSAVRLRFEP